MNTKYAVECLKKRLLNLEEELLFHQQNDGPGLILHSMNLEIKELQSAIDILQGDREKIMLKAIKAYQRMVNAYRVGEKELPEWVFQNIGEFKAICKKGEKDE
jgi:hypothetical protein